MDSGTATRSKEQRNKPVSPQAVSEIACNLGCFLPTERSIVIIKVEYSEPRLFARDQIDPSSAP